MQRELEALNKKNRDDKSKAMSIYEENVTRGKEVAKLNQDFSDEKRAADELARHQANADLNGITQQQQGRFVAIYGNACRRRCKVAKCGGSEFS